MTGPEAFGLGVLGGVLVEIAGLFKLRTEAIPAYLKSPFYWAMTFLMIAAGGALAWLHLFAGSNMQVWLVVNIGASAPLLISSLTTPPKVG